MSKPIYGYVGSNNDDFVFNTDYSFVWGRYGDDVIIDQTKKGATPKVDDNTYRGMDGNDTIVTYSGSDHLRGGSGNDTFYSYNQDDITVAGGKGRDVLYIIVDDPSSYEDLAFKDKKVHDIQVEDHTISVQKVENVHFVDAEHGWSLA